MVPRTMFQRPSRLLQWFKFQLVTRDISGKVFHARLTMAAQSEEMPGLYFLLITIMMGLQVFLTAIEHQTPSPVSMYTLRCVLVHCIAVTDKTVAYRTGLLPVHASGNGQYACSRQLEKKKVVYMYVLVVWCVCMW